MTNTATVWVAVIAALLAAVIALLIVLIVQGANAERERKLAECDVYPPSDASYWLCVEMVD